MMIQIHHHAIPTKRLTRPIWGSGGHDFPLHKMIGWGLIGPGAQQEDVALRALVGEFSPFYLYQW